MWWGMIRIWQHNMLFWKILDVSENRGQSPAKIANATGENDDSVVDSGVAYFESHPDHVTPKNRDIQMDWATHIFWILAWMMGIELIEPSTFVHGSKHKKHKGLPFANPHSYLIMFTNTKSSMESMFGINDFWPIPKLVQQHGVWRYLFPKLKDFNLWCSLI